MESSPFLAAGHVALFIITILPLFFNIETNLNIVLTAAATVFCGCWRSVKSEPPAEAMTRKDALKFPVVGSVILFSLFLAFKFLPKDMVNLVLSAYFVMLGTAALIATAEPVLTSFGVASFNKLSDASVNFKIPRIMDVSFTYLELLLSIPAAGFCFFYWNTKHWFANNILGLAFSLQGIEHLSLGAIQNGVILLTGSFFYDVFWVFCTPVMVSVAKSFDAPIKLLFPRIPAALDGGSKFSMLGLGDIVIPGIFVAIILRYDHHHMNHQQAKKSGSLFPAAFIGYVVGLAATIVVMNAFKAAQPALLYIVPAVLACTFGRAALGGRASHLFHWKETEDDKKQS
jgi:minor histocompatibility antigen H13